MNEKKPKLRGHMVTHLMSNKELSVLDAVCKHFSKSRSATMRMLIGAIVDGDPSVADSVASSLGLTSEAVNNITRVFLGRSPRMAVALPKKGDADTEKQEDK